MDRLQTQLPSMISREAADRLSHHDISSRIQEHQHLGGLTS